jgi:hypothetical protein
MGLLGLVPGVGLRRTRRSRGAWPWGEVSPLLLASCGTWVLRPGEFLSISEIYMAGDICEDQCNRTSHHFGPLDMMSINISLNALVCGEIDAGEKAGALIVISLFIVIIS